MKSPRFGLGDKLQRELAIDVEDESHGWFGGNGIHRAVESLDAALEFHLMEETIRQLRAEIAALKFVGYERRPKGGG